MARSKKSAAKESEPVAVPAPSTKSTVAAAAGASLADVFAQSAAFFGKKASYEQVQEAKPAESLLAEKASVDDDEHGKPGAPPATEKSEKKKKKKNRKRKQEELDVFATAESTNESGAAVLTGAADGDDDSAELPASGDAKSDRTVFVGNVSLDATSSNIKQFFSSCGKVDSVRLRFLPVAGTAVNEHGNQKLMMKVCANKKIFTDKRDFCHAYVTFVDKASVDGALKLNRSMFMNKSIRVDRENPQIDPQRSVFVGNLAFQVTDEAVWTFFDKQLRSDEEKAPVENVRVIRDRNTGEGKGFGYVLLKSKALAAKALSLHERKLGLRELRVQVCGKRFKNQKGDDPKQKQKHEGRRATPGAASRLALKKQTREPEVAVPTVKRRKTEEASASLKQDTKHNQDKATPGKLFVKAVASGKLKNTKQRAGKGMAKAGKEVGKGTRARGAPPHRSTPKPKKPKHAARKAKQAAEAAAKANSS